jgi:hypothetical protein
MMMLLMDKYLLQAHGSMFECKVQRRMFYEKKISKKQYYIHRNKISWTSFRDYFEELILEVTFFKQKNNI